MCQIWHFKRDKVTDMTLLINMGRPLRRSFDASSTVALALTTCKIHGRSDFQITPLSATGSSSHLNKCPTGRSPMKHGGNFGREDGIFVALSSSLLRKKIVRFKTLALIRLRPVDPDRRPATRRGSLGGPHHLPDRAGALRKTQLSERWSARSGTDRLKPLYRV